MTTQPTAPLFDDIEQILNDDKTFAREERREILQIAELATVAMPDDVMERQQINYKSEAFRGAYSQGYPALLIGLKGVSVSYDFAPDKILRIYVPLYGSDPDKLGQLKGRNSRAHITREAFKAVFGLTPFGRENQAKLIGRTAIWGQHLGDAVLAGQAREWAWDVPREALAPDYKYEGQVRSIQGRGAPGAGGTTVGTPALAEPQANAKIVELLVGLSSIDAEIANKRILETPGLPDKYYTRATQGNVLQLAHEDGLITADDDGKVIPMVAESAVA